ncbi:MAG TPA: DUF4340 domain-containing protein [Candidatus Binatia bacterium]|nr:DUF4340 domain-containing protein [Candidatus Binatia bacterium]
MLVALVGPPARPRLGRDAVTGHRVFPFPRHAVRTVDVTLGERRFGARRTTNGWEIDGQPAAHGVAVALDDLVEALVALRALDAFRSRDGSSYGLDASRATIALATARKTRRLEIGDTNPAGSAFYARRAGDPRVLQLGTGLLGDVERVFYNRDGPPPG